MTISLQFGWEQDEFSIQFALWNELNHEMWDIKILKILEAVKSGWKGWYCFKFIRTAAELHAKIQSDTKLYDLTISRVPQIFQ